jgi:hypothetical protein
MYYKLICKSCKQEFEIDTDLPVQANSCPNCDAVPASLYNKPLKERVEDTKQQITMFLNKSLLVMLEKNAQRGDAWRNSGLLGQFVEIHSMYFRLRNLVWETKCQPLKDKAEWKAQIVNALEDLRNFTMLAELCVLEENWDGERFTDDIL